MKASSYPAVMKACEAIQTKLRQAPAETVGGSSGGSNRLEETFKRLGVGAFAG